MRAHVAVHPSRVLAKEVVGEQRDVVATPPQRRHADDDDVKAVVEVFAELAGRDLALQVGVGGGDDPRIDGDGLVGADPLDLAFLQRRAAA